ncbi:MAG: hypothetical protein BRC40_03465 [Cyanobacteria bacterium QH_8_48_120]|jgi:hypothetical protein|nr:MAG: hypothetical protein BRC34_02790 [Cyanobacteria bacterium QH_1_48_107]PSO57711.1 MAG: hypothetical protein BRC35_06970 [Cyanobacteria bacterium QH_10_48_56]PSO59544.1 MAG: hypothetical protein BRC36_15475 [Cyanobacteria bacterium QH_2_48_84]PSO61915.1 MAG: hypothetical protein BRC39_07080 [Cyanobacteria bacterium QH_7_48_89]PSO66897.1 MAG: hypothetical protein BRC38_04485 [Cyanobacteria bacterium QH_6_48_35]PSO70936.1 MAG: hypothetical protein BRC37_14680 [Cyanobacteria bacterium QH_3_
MFTIELTLKNTALPLSVQRKESEDAEALYQKIVEAMRSEHPQLLELSCDRQPDRKLGILSDQISAVVISEKSGAATPGRTTGFSAMPKAE